MAFDIIDIYDENRNKLNKTVERKTGAYLKNNEYFVAVECWIINSKNEILLTRRSLNKSNGGKWECTGGLSTTGETSLQGIQRELQEEIGLNILDNELQLVKTFKEIDYNKHLNNFRDIYIIKKDITLSELTFSDREVIDSKYVSLDEFNDMLANGEVINRLKYLNELWDSIKN